jgi:tRNA modification GTPase
METIIAQATPPGESAIGVIRVSGDLPLEIAQLCCNKNEVQPRVATLTDYRGQNGELIDQVLITYFEAGKSYTGEESLEISCHGNPLIAELICKDLLVRGCRLAEPGEFTKRAFLNGKIDLSQAEAVAQIIAAKNDHSLALAHRNLKGELSKKLTLIQESILELQASQEAHIDFPEDGLGEEDSVKTLEHSHQIINELKVLLDQAQRTKLMLKNIRVVLVGHPNVGKSSLFNALAGKNRALIHAQAGTTRDYLETEIKLGDSWITLVDTAGVHETNDEIEMAGIDLTKDQADLADIILWVIDNSVPSPTLLPAEFTTYIQNKPTLLVRNKQDLGNSGWKPDKNLQLPEIHLSLKNSNDISEIEIQLQKKVKEIIGSGAENELLIGARHEALILSCLKDMQLFLDDSQNEIGYELSSKYLSSARNHIDQMIGFKSNEDMLDLLFGKFCIGK